MVSESTLTAAHHAAHDEAQLMAAFHRAAAMPWYCELLSEAGVAAGEIVDAASFLARAPLLTKANTFGRFPINQLAAGTSLRDLAGVLTSSGDSGRFAFGLTTRSMAAAGPDFVDDSLDAAFGVRSRATLAVNCLPMGVGFGSACMTVATTSVREDMALALIEGFGRDYDLVLIVGDPLFMKRLVDYAAGRAFDWSRYRLAMVLGEEIFGEHFRSYLAACVGLDLSRPAPGYIMSSFGVGELGLHLAHETPATIAVRRAAWENPGTARELLGVDAARASMPMVLTFNPRRTLIEVVDPDEDGYGLLAISMLSPGMPVPLLRYQTGDVARLLDSGAVRAACERHRVRIPGELPSTLLALAGRFKERLRNGADTGCYKDALYADPAIARHVTGAFRVSMDGRRCTLHVQRRRDAEIPEPLADQDLRSGILQAIAPAVRPSDVVMWPYDRFPFGMTLDYERKFAYVSTDSR